LLHVAPEQQIRRKLRSVDNLTYFAGDGFEEGYTYPSDTLPLDVTRLPFHSEVFDIVICNHVLEHVLQDHQALRELRRIMKPGATAILQVPIARNLLITYEDDTIHTPEEREAAYGQPDHCRLYGQDYGRRLEAAGFLVERNRPWANGQQSKVHKEALNPDEEIFAARRPLG
jgi:SAM-dependent methyltransferase